MAPKLPIYLDNNATTRCDPRVVEAMLPYLTETYGNAASRNHSFGWAAEEAVEQAREEVAALIGGTAKEIVWTSGATESNNLAVMLANNEIGVIQPVAEIGAICREHGVIFHCDAVQATGKVAIDVNAMNIDLLSISGHKMYGPKGIGALYVRRARPRVRLQAIIDGGGHERGMRSGTLPVHQIVGLGKAAVYAKEDLDSGKIDEQRRLRDRLWAGLQENLDELYINGSMEQRLPNNLNVSFAYVEGEALMMAIRDIAVSSGSACTSASLEPSYVLRALGVEAELAHTSIRFGLGRFTTEEEVDYAIALLTEKVRWLREMSPLYEMVKEGIDLKSIQWEAH